jgi:hypothetical protein
MNPNYESLKDTSPEGMYILPLEDYFDGVYFVPYGLYTGSILRFRIRYVEDGHAVNPTLQIQFKTLFHHPLINSLTQCLSTTYTTLPPLLQFISQIVQIDTMSIFGQNTSEWMGRIQETIFKSQMYLYDDHDSEIQFFPWDLDTHQQQLKHLLTK